MRFKNLFLLFVFYPVFGIAQDQGILSGLANPELIEKNLIPQCEWVSFPEYCDRESWLMIPDEVKKRIVAKGEEVLDFQWAIVKATDYLEFERSGNRNIMQSPYFKRKDALQSLVLAELFEGEGRFTDQIINGVWAISEQSSWALSAHMYLQEAGYGLPDVEEPVIDLFGGEIASLFSWIHYFLRDELDKVDTLISRRIRYEIKNRILDVYRERDDFWWLGFENQQVNNWNVWVNHNMLTTLLLMEEDSRLKAEGIYKSMKSVDRFIDYYKTDGGCDEGPSYWGHAGGALYEYLELLGLATGGYIDIFDKEKIQNIGSYIYKAHISWPYVINFADASPKSGSRPGIIYRYGKSIDDPVMQSYGAFLARKAEWKRNIPGGNLEAALNNLFMTDEICNVKAEEPLISNFYLPDLQICGARDKEGSAEGFFMAAKAGHNMESHNHNDVGNYIVYYNGKPAIIDVGVGTYTKKTFSPQRYEIWTMQSQYHNCPGINGQQQSPGKEYNAKDFMFTNRPGKAIYTADIASAYPQEAYVKSWVRTISLNRGVSVDINERFELEQVSDTTSLNIMTCLTPSELSEGILSLKSDDYELLLSYDHSKADLKVEPISLEDPRLIHHWGEKIYRLVFTLSRKSKKDSVSFSIKPAN